MSIDHVAFNDATGWLSFGWGTFDDAVDAIRAFCERGATLDEIAARPHARFVSWLGRVAH